MESVVHVLTIANGAPLYMLIGAIMVVAIVGITQWRSCRTAQIEASLKRDMLEKGMSADDIAKVIGATAREPADTRAS